MKTLQQLTEEANDAWRAWMKDRERQKDDAAALERLQPALSELRERFRWPRERDDRAPQPAVHEDEQARYKAEYAVFRVFAAGGRWSPPET